MVWNKKAIDPQSVKKLAQQYELDLITSSILVRRGITEAEDLRFVLEDDLKYVHAPYQFIEMEDAVERIVQAAEEQEKVMVYGDRDVDGITSTVLLVVALREMKINVEWQVPRGDESYGLSKDDIQSFADRDITLLITVDCGISNKEEVSFANDKGIDVIVTDHHLPPEELPPALAVLNPKLEDSGYPFESLAGCAVVSKLVWALKFTETPFYNRSVCLINCIPGNDSIIVEGIKLVNMVEVDKIREILVPGIASLNHPKLQDFLVGQELFVFNSEQQYRMLKKVFGENIDISLTDISEEVFTVYPSLKGWSLFKLVQKSRFARYGEATEIDILEHLFRSVIYDKYPNLYSRFNEQLDLVALGTVADLMPLADENRVIVKNGLKALTGSKRTGMRELLFCQNLQGKKISAVDIAWQLAPLINATGRLGVPHKAVELLLSTDPQEARGLADEVVTINNERKALGLKLWDKIFAESQTSFTETDGKLIVINDKEMHRGITGIIANKLVNYYKTPAIVLAYLGDKVVGSMRCVPGINGKNFLQQFEHLMNDFGGHEMAAGFNLPVNNLEQFLKGIKRNSAALVIEEIEEVLEIDAEIPHKYMNPDLIKIVDLFEPFGEQNEQLTFLAKDVVINDISLMGKSDPQHVRMLIEAGQYKWPAVFWKASDKVGTLIDNGEKVNIVFTLGRNFFQNREKLQLTILDVQK